VTKQGRLPFLALGLASAYLISIISIQVAAPDEVIEPDEFPLMCSEDSLNCSMIGPISYRSGNLTELRINSSLEDVMDKVRMWIDTQSGTTVIGDWPGQTHTVFRSLMFRFPDDFVVKGFCDDGETVLHVFSKSRLGVSDLGVNKARVQSFAQYMSNVEMATSDCV
jgi:uncharacterized protein (DUF1499 family)